MLLPRLQNNGKTELWLNQLQQQTKNDIQSKIQAGIYKYEKLDNCPICASANFDLISERDRYGFYYPVCICRGCGLLSVNPRLNQPSYNEFYRLEYRKLYLGKEEPTEAFFKQQYAQGEKIYSYLKEHKLLDESTKTVLEVGCGAGGILQYFKEKGYKTQGVDLGTDYLAYGINNYSLDLHNTNLKDFKPAFKPDIIIYSHVLEHLLDLKEELNQIKGISHPQTKIYIEIPSLKQMHKGYDLNILKYFHIAHTFHFTLTSLTNLLGTNGFKLNTGNEFVKAVFEPGSTEHFIVTNDYKEAISYIKKFEKMRWLYFISPKGIKYYAGMAIIKTLRKFGLKQTIKDLIE